MTLSTEATQSESWVPAQDKFELDFDSLLVTRSAVSSVAKRTLTIRKVWGLIPGPCRQRLATVVTILRSCVAQALSRGDGPCNSLHASA